jgi:hypothetical protein
MISRNAENPGEAVHWDCDGIKAARRYSDRMSKQPTTESESKIEDIAAAFASR